MTGLEGRGSTIELRPPYILHQLLVPKRTRLVLETGLPRLQRNPRSTWLPTFIPFRKWRISGEGRVSLSYASAKISQAYGTLVNERSYKDNK